MTLTLQAASARRNPRVPHANERLIIWVLTERPLEDRNGRFLRVVIDVDGVCWPKWRRVYCDSVELMSPELFPPRTLEVAEPPRDPPRNICAKCGRVFRMAGGRTIHERVCGHESLRTVAATRAGRGGGLGYWRPQPKVKGTPWTTSRRAAHERRYRAVAA
jgi:hypothetical protein